MNLAYALLLACVIGLAGCSTRPVIPLEPKVVVKIERIVTPIPAELLNIPDPIPSLTPNAIRSNDKAVAKWLLDSEERTLQLEAQIRRIRELYVKQLQELATH